MGRLTSPAALPAAVAAPPSTPERARTRGTRLPGSWAVTLAKSAPASSRAAAAIRARAGATSLVAASARVVAVRTSSSRRARLSASAPDPGDVIAVPASGVAETPALHLTPPRIAAPVLPECADPPPHGELAVAEILGHAGQD